MKTVYNVALLSFLYPTERRAAKGMNHTRMCFILKVYSYGPKPVFSTPLHSQLQRTILLSGEPRTGSLLTSVLSLNGFACVDLWTGAALPPPTAAEPTFKFDFDFCSFGSPTFPAPLRPFLGPDSWRDFADVGFADGGGWEENLIWLDAGLLGSCLL